MRPSLAVVRVTPATKLATRRGFSALLVAPFVGCLLPPPSVSATKAVVPPSPASASQQVVAAKPADPLKEPPDLPDYPCPPPEVREFEEASKASKESSRPSKRKPDVEQGNGRLPPEDIQRTIRARYPQFRSCYEQGLGRDPNLIGRVTMRFVIGRDGNITSIQPVCTSMPDREVVRCVTEAYKPLTFLQPQGGIVTVIYPIMFSPGD